LPLGLIAAFILAAGKLTQRVARHIAALAAVDKAPVLTTLRHRTLALKRLTIQCDANQYNMRFPELATVAQQPAAELHLQQCVNHEFRALVLERRIAALKVALALIEKRIWQSRPRGINREELI